MWNTLKTIFSNLIVTGHLQVLGPRLYEVPYVGIKNSEILWKNILFELDALYYRPELACHLFPALPTAKHWATKLSQTNWSRNKGEDKRTLTEDIVGPKSSQVSGFWKSARAEQS